MKRFAKIPVALIWLLLTCACAANVQPAAAPMAQISSSEPTFVYVSTRW